MTDANGERTGAAGCGRWLRFAAYVAVLYAGLVHNLFCVPEDVSTCRGEFRSTGLSGDCSLVANRLRATEELRKLRQAQEAVQLVS